MTVLLNEIAGEQFAEQRRLLPRKPKRRIRRRSRRCATCGKERHSHRNFKSWLWCPIKMRGIDDATPIYLLTWRDS